MNHRVPNNNIPLLGLGSFNPRTYTCAEFGGGAVGEGGCCSIISKTQYSWGQLTFSVTVLSSFDSFNT